jgi:predicted ATPase
MPFSPEMRKLESKWNQGRHWPKRVEWIEIHGIRGWAGQRIDFNFPFVAIAGENGVGKSTILQSLAAIYKSQHKHQFASDFFPDTTWDSIQKAQIQYSVREGDKSIPGSVRKPSDRWRGNPDRRQRDVAYIDLRRIQPIPARVGYSRIAKPSWKETSHRQFDSDTLSRFSSITGRGYEVAGLSLTDADEKRWTPVVTAAGARYSGFHQGAGEAALVELLNTELPKYAIILIDEFETSLHPRSQRRLVRDLANHCRLKELQVIVTTHSPYVLDELPDQGRLYVTSSLSGQKTILTGVSPFFAMTQMDEDRHPEIDIFVEDDRSKILLEEIIIAHKPELLARSAIIQCGAASVGQHLGQMVAADRFPRKSLVVLDGEQEPAVGCLRLPGGDVPERVVFEGLRSLGYPGMNERIAPRSVSELIDAAEYAMTNSDHHSWVNLVADRIIIGGNTLWRAMCGSWAAKCLNANDSRSLIEAIENALNNRPFQEPRAETVDPLKGEASVTHDAARAAQPAVERAAQPLVPTVRSHGGYLFGMEE